MINEIKQNINDLFAIIGVIANILFSCLNFRFTKKNKKNKLSIEQMKKDIETDLKNDHKERRKIEEYTSLMEKSVKQLMQFLAF